MFFFKIAAILFFHNNQNYAINLIFKKSLFYEFLYNMFQKKLKILQEYIKNNFANSRIRYLIINIETFVLFVFKSNNDFRLCVDYKSLNAITLKNKVSLFFINKTLNRLISVKYFIKLNFKNVYYRIRIKLENK